MSDRCCLCPTVAVYVRPYMFICPTVVVFLRLCLCFLSDRCCLCPTLGLFDRREFVCPTIYVFIKILKFLLHLIEKLHLKKYVLLKMTLILLLKETPEQ